MTEKITFPCFRDHVGNTFVFPTVYTRETVETFQIGELEQFCFTYSFLLNVERVEDFVTEIDETETLKITHVIADLSSPVLEDPVEVYMVAGPLFDQTANV